MTFPSPADPRFHTQLRLLNELGLDQVQERFDAFAADLATVFADQLGAGAELPYAMVNMVTDEQRFVGLYCPDGKPAVGRTMSRDHGYCPEVVQRRRALVLPDVYAHPRFAGNVVVDQIGIRTYAGAPLVHEPTGTVLGTVCVVGTTGLPLSTGEPSRALIKDHAARLMTLIGDRPAGRHARCATDSTAHG